MIGAMSTPVVQLDGLQTENRNSQTTDIDRVSTLELCRVLNEQDREVPAAVERCIPVIANVIDCLSERVRKGGRVFYIGAGTSGRLGVLDASEIPPTYSAPFGQFVALMAGGDDALRRAKEGAEDDRDGAEADLQPFNLNPEVDSLIAIASSGRTPYVLGGLSYARSLGVVTVALVCVSPSSAGLEGNADHLISVVTGPEPVTGSTRMKAGTATKLVLNMISTGIMIKLGKTYGNLMIDVKATNIKLKQRARNIVRVVGGKDCTQSDAELDQILESCSGSVKLAAVVIALKVSVAEAEERLQRNDGVLARVFQDKLYEYVATKSCDDDLVLCVDAGGTSCMAIILSRDGEMGMSTSGPCNITNIGINGAVSTISEAIEGAVDACQITKGRQIQSIGLSAAWIGMAGYGRPSPTPAIDDALSKLLNLPQSGILKITNDIDLLPTSLDGCSGLDSVVVLVAGTGSVAMSYVEVDGQFQRKHRLGGWGHLLGDDGSAYSIGREALRRTLTSSDIYNIQASQDSSSAIISLPPLSQAVMRYLKKLSPNSQPGDFLSMILTPEPALHEAEDASLATTQRIANVARLVLSMAKSDDEARRIVDAGASSLVNMVAQLVRIGGMSPSRSGLVLAGGMMQDKIYREAFTTTLKTKCDPFKTTKIVSRPAAIGAQYLLHKVISDSLPVI